VLPCVVILLQAMLMWAVLTYITIYWIDLGFSHLQVGLLVAVFPLTSLLLMIPFGLYVDRISPKKLVIASYFIFAGAIAGLLFTHDFWLTLLLMVAGGAANALFSNALPSLFFKTLGNELRGLKLGAFNAANLVGYGLGPLVAGYIYSASSMNEVYIFALIGFIPITVVSLFLADSPGHVIKLSDYKTDLSEKSTLIFILLVFFFSLHAGAEQSSLSLYLNKGIGLDKEGVGWMFFIHANVMALLAVVNGVIGDRLSARGRKLANLFYLSIFISGITNMSLIFATDFGSVLATRLTHAMGDSLNIVIRSMIMADLFVSTRMGGNLGAVTAAITLATLIGAVISGASPGYASGFFICGALAVLAVLASLFAKPDF